MGAALVSNNFSPILSKFSLHMKKKKWLITARNLQSIKIFLLLNWVSMARLVACFPQASLSRPAATAANSETPCICVRPAQAEPESCPKSLAVDFAL